MADKTPLEIARDIVTVDATRSADDPFKMPAYLLALVIERITRYEASVLTLSLNLGDKLGASARLDAAYRQLENLLRDEYNFIKALPSYAISEADKRELFNKYGWAKGLIGDFDHARLQKLAGLALSVPPTLSNPAYRIPQQLADLINAQLQIVLANESISGGGDKELATQAKDRAERDLEIVCARVQNYYASASDERFYTKELARISFQPKRMPGQVQHDDPTPPIPPVA